MYIIYVLWWSIYVFLCVSGQSEQTTTWLAFYFIQFFLLVGLAFFSSFLYFLFTFFFVLAKKNCVICKKFHAAKSARFFAFK